MSGKHAMVDEDCPVCQAMAADLESPFFWHLDGCNMDDSFEFSYFKRVQSGKQTGDAGKNSIENLIGSGKERDGRISIDEAPVVAGEDGPLH
jgi:hypothetical protein